MTDSNSGMIVDQLRRLYHTRPFQAFDIHLADGRSLPAAHPELLAITPPGRTIGVGLEDGTIEIVDLMLVTSLKPRRSGRSRSRKRAG